MSSIRINELPQGEKMEQLDVVIATAFKTLMSNVNQIKKWCEKSEDNFMIIDDKIKKTQKRLENVERSVQESTKHSKCIVLWQNYLNQKAHERIENSERFLLQAFDHLGSFTQAFRAHFGEGEMQPLERYTSISAETYSETYTPTNVAALDEAFARWKVVDDEIAKGNEGQETTLMELRILAERTRERLMSWRDTLSANAHLVESMSLTLVSTQREIALLKESQLTMPPIAEYVDQSREDLEKQVAASRADMLESETRMAEAIGQQEDKVNQMVSGAEALIANTKSGLVDHIVKTVNPILAQVNSLAVGQVNIDERLRSAEEVKSTVPEIQGALERLEQSLQDTASHSAQARSAISGRIDDLTKQIYEEAQNTASKREIIMRKVVETGDAFSKELKEVMDALEKTHADISDGQSQSMRLREEVTDLDNKMTKWVESKYLPAKISEARLFSLERNLEQMLRTEPVNATPRERRIRQHSPSYSPSRSDEPSVTAPQAGILPTFPFTQDMLQTGMPRSPPSKTPPRSSEGSRNPRSSLPEAGPAIFKTDESSLAGLVGKQSNRLPRTPPERIIK